MHISVSAKGKSIRFELNDSSTAKALYGQLPLTVQVESYADNEMIFYPPQKLAVDHAPMADAKVGTLAYYAPWGDVVMFYRDFGSARDLYELGRAVSGTEYIGQLTGKITIEKAD